MSLDTYSTGMNVAKKTVISFDFQGSIDTSSVIIEASVHPLLLLNHWTIRWKYPSAAPCFGFKDGFNFFLWVHLRTFSLSRSVPFQFITEGFCLCTFLQVRKTSEMADSLLTSCLTFHDVFPLENSSFFVLVFHNIFVRSGNLLCVKISISPISFAIKRGLKNKVHFCLRKKKLPACAGGTFRHQMSVLSPIHWWWAF